MKKQLYLFVIPLTLLILAACGAKAPAGPTPTSDPVVAAAGEKVVDDLAAGNADAVFALFDEKVAKALPLEQVAGLWDQLVAQVGKYQGRGSANVAPKQGFLVASVPAKFEKQALIINVVFNRDMKISGLNFQPATTPTPAAYIQPAYVETSEFTEEEVTIGSGKWALPGTLTLPKGKGPYPAVVLVHGSGPNDRDETIGPNRPFKDIAWGLASQGIAVLRYDKRTKAHADLFTPEVLESLTLDEETSDDAILAAKLLAKDKRIDPMQIYVLGHSQGGIAAPRIGEQYPDLAGLIILAGLAGRLEDTVTDQLTYIAGLDGMISDAEKSQLQMVKTAAAKVKDPALSSDTPSEELPLGIPAAWWLDLRDYYPAETAMTLDMPILLLQGGRDYQVTKADFDIWQQTLKGKINAQLIFYPDLNHLFMTGEGMATPEEYMQPASVAQAVIDQIAEWIKGAK
jgi:hypothetical protein